MWKLALHTVSYAGFWRGQDFLPLKDVLKKARELGFDGVMIMAKRPHLSICDVSIQGIKEINKLLESLKLEVACLAGYNDFTAGIERPMTPWKEINLVYLEKLLEIARNLNCGILRVFTGFEREGIFFDNQWKLCVETLKEASQRAEKYGVTIAIQNHHDIAVYPSVLKWLVEEVDHPNCKLAFDAWAPCLQGIRGEEFKNVIKQLKNYIVHTTVADYVSLPRFKYEPELNNFITRTPAIRAVQMGEGIIDYTSFFEGLAEINYQGWVAYEMCEVLKGGGGLKNLDFTAKKFIEYMKQWF